MLLPTMRVSIWQSALPISRLSRVAVLFNECHNVSLKRSYATSGSSPLLSVAQLKKAIESSSRPVLLDCTWFMPNIPRDAFAEFKQSRIPGARFFNLDEVIDKASPYPHMLPSAEDFAKAVGSPSFLLQPWDNTECSMSGSEVNCRTIVWWTFKVFGHKGVSVLDGGLPAWKKEEGELETTPPKECSPTTYPVPKKDDNLVRSFEQITELAKNGDKSVQILDARSAGRFHGSDPEPRKGLSSGHIPGSISLPFQKLIDPETGKYRNASDLRTFFDRELDPSKETITSCGTGVTASIIYLALEASGFPSKRSLYDGSWTEYAARHADNPDMIVKDAI